MRRALSCPCWMLQWGNTCLVALFPILKWTGNLDFIWYKRIIIKYWQMVSLQKTYTEPWSHASLRQVKCWFAARRGVRTWWGLEATVHVLCARHFCQSTPITLVFYVCGCWLLNPEPVPVACVSVNNQAKFPASLMPYFPCYEMRHHLWRHLLMCIGLHK